MERSPLRHIEPSQKRQETGPARVNKARLPRNLEDPFDLNYKKETGLDTPLPLGKAKPETLNNESAEILEMTDEDVIPKGDDISALLAVEGEEPLSRQQRRAEARQTEKKSRKTENKITPPPLPPSGIKKAYGFYPAGSLDKVISRIDAVEEEIIKLQDVHDNLAFGTRATEEELRAELEFLKEALGKTDLKTDEKRKIEKPIKAEPAPLGDEESPGLQLNLEEELTEHERGFVQSKKNKPLAKKEADVDLERLADKYGIVISPEARAQRLHDSNKTLRDHASELPEAIRLEQLLTDDEETLRTTPDITDSNKKSLTARIRETKKKLAPFSEALEARNERETLLKYPTAAEEVGFNLEETVQEMARTKKTNVIRLQELRNTLADLKRMEGLIGAVETTKKPLPLPRKNRAERSITETEQLAEQLGITLDPREREAIIATLQGEVRDLQNKFNKVDDEITSLQGKLAKTNIIKVQERLTQQIHALEEQREQIRNRYNNAGDRYSEALASPATAQEEIDNRLNELDDRLSVSKDLNPIMKEMRELEQLKALLPPPLSEKETQPQDLGLDYAYEPKQEEEPASAEVDLDEENTVDVVEPEEATFQWTPSRNKILREEEAKFRAPREERDLPPRVLPGQTRESLVQRIGKMDEMLRTGAVDGKVMSSQRLQQLARGRDALARSLNTAYDTSTAEANDNGRISGSRETLLPFPTSGSSDPEILEEDRLIAEHEVVKTEQAQTRERNVQVYRARAQEYKKELQTIANALAERGEFVEVPGQVPLTTEPEKKSWYSSAWTKIKEATVRRDVAALKKQYETALERYEEANQLKNAVERNTPVYKRANITGELKGSAEKPGQVEQRRAEQVVFEDRLQHLTKTERSAQDTMDSLVLNQRMDGTILEKKEKRKAADKIGEALSEQRTDNEEYNGLTRARLNNIPIIQLQKLAAGEEFNQYFEFDEETLEEIQAIQRSTERTLKALEAKVTLAKTKMERDAARKRLNELKKLLGGKDPEEMADRAAFLVRAAERVGLMEIEDPSLHQDLASRYGARINELRTWLEPKGREAELLTDLEKELNQVTQEANKKF